MTTMICIASWKPLRQPPRSWWRRFDRLARFVDAARWLCSRNRNASFTRWYAEPCDRCGRPRNYRVRGHFQVVCYTCASPRESAKRRITPDALLRDAAERKN